MVASATCCLALDSVPGINYRILMTIAGRVASSEDHCSSSGKIGRGKGSDWATTELDQGCVAHLKKQKHEDLLTVVKSDTTHHQGLCGQDLSLSRTG